MTYLFDIQKHQLDSFKAHAVEIAAAIKTIEPIHRIKGRKRVDWLARACGYKGHSDLIHHVSTNGSMALSLGLFSPLQGKVLASNYARVSGISSAVVCAAMVKAASELYTHAEDAHFEWTVNDILSLPNEVASILYPVPNLGISLANNPTVLAIRESMLGGAQFGRLKLAADSQVAMRSMINNPATSQLMRSMQSSTDFLNRTSWATSTLERISHRHNYLENMPAVQNIAALNSLVNRVSGFKQSSELAAVLQKVEANRAKMGNVSASLWALQSESIMRMNQLVDKLNLSRYGN